MNDTDTEKHHRGGHGPAPEKGAHESRLCPSPRLQAYCLDHFLMECEIYHEQENNRYHKLVAHSRQMFLEKQSQDNSSNQPASAPMRLQPSRRAKENRSNPAITPPATPEPKRPADVPFKPAKLEKAFKNSQHGAMFRILTDFRKKLQLQKSWEDYRSLLETKVKERANRLLTDIKKGRNIHTNCVFSGPLGIQCRYCGFVDTVQDNVATTPRKLAPPAPMHDIQPPFIGGNVKESGLMFRGINFFVDVCGDKTMIILVDFKGLLDLCVELFEEEEALTDSPTSLFARLSSIESKPRGTSAAGAKRPLGEPKPDRGRKRRKPGTESNARGKSSSPGVNKR
ncbi:hypothetical protein F5X98DRAFT_363563 [Xylaria grammica]|nr:hypothetical protein F5X98DRAFT_363563 [Xylaria grammica]